MRDNILVPIFYKVFFLYIARCIFIFFLIPNTQTFTKKCGSARAIVMYTSSHSFEIQSCNCRLVSSTYNST